MANRPMGFAGALTLLCELGGAGVSILWPEARWIGLLLIIVGFVPMAIWIRGNSVEIRSFLSSRFALRKLPTKKERPSKWIPLIAAGQALYEKLSQNAKSEIARTAKSKDISIASYCSTALLTSAQDRHIVIEGRQEPDLAYEAIPTSDLAHLWHTDEDKNELRSLGYPKAEWFDVRIRESDIAKIAAGFEEE